MLHCVQLDAFRSLRAKSHATLCKAQLDAFRSLCAKSHPYSYILYPKPHKVNCQTHENCQNIDGFQSPSALRGCSALTRAARRAMAAYISHSSAVQTESRCDSSFARRLRTLCALWPCSALTLPSTKPPARSYHRPPRLPPPSPPEAHPAPPRSAPRPRAAPARCRCCPKRRPTS